MCFFVFSACTLEYDSHQDEQNGFKDDLTQQFPAFKKCLENDRRKQTQCPTEVFDLVGFLPQTCEYINVCKNDINYLIAAARELPDQPNVSVHRIYEVMSPLPMPYECARQACSYHLMAIGVNAKKNLAARPKDPQNIIAQHITIG